MLKVRFAPSPTGYLHVGGARTALFNWLHARSKGGKFVLRIEDTDPERSREYFEEDIKKQLEWLGLMWDELYRQSDRADFYGEYFEKLKSEEKIYPCFCDPQKLEEARKKAREKGEPYKYPGTCRKLSREEREQRLRDGQRAAWRFAVPENEDVKWRDFVKGEVVYNTANLEDFVVRRGDGSYTYNYCVVVDDATMGINFVLRGEDHVPNTPKQILLYKALSFDVPEFAHIPLILNKEGKKLSKREGGATVVELHVAGYLPQSVVNWLALMGWSHPEEKEIFKVEELVNRFTVERLNTSPARFDLDKLRYINSVHMKELGFEEFVREFENWIAYVKKEKAYTEDVENLLENVKGVVNRLSKYFVSEKGNVLNLAYLFRENAANFYELVKILLEVLEDKVISDEDRIKFCDNWSKFCEVLYALVENLQGCEWSMESIKATFKLAIKQGCKGKNLYKPFRLVATNLADGPNITEVVYWLGKERVLKRLNNYVKSLSANFN